MAKLTTKQRKALPQSSYALPGKRFPENDKTHARVAEAYASRMVKKGQLSKADQQKVDNKAKRVLGKGKK